MSGNPVRVSGLDIHLVDDGYVVYQEPAKRVHYLNVTAALVLELCDGTRSDAQIADEVAAFFGLEAAPAAETAQCLAQLRDEQLVVPA